MSRWLIILFAFVTIDCQSVNQEEVVDIGYETEEELWAQAGSIGYGQSADKMKQNHTGGEPLSERDRSALRPIFGNLVDQVTIHWNATPINEMVASEYDIEMVGEDASAQAFGYDIYFQASKDEWSDEFRLKILIHEITHTEQFVRLGNSFSDFGYQYFREYYRAGQVYEQNSMEVEAINKADRYFSTAFKNWKAFGLK